MTINISARNYSVFIGGLDCTIALKSADGGFAHYDQTGLSLISATFVLGKAFEFSENLDDRINSRWARGNLIIVLVANSLGVLTRAPVLGQLYILESQYDENSRELKIEAGCILSLLNFRSPAGEGICFSLGSTTSLTSIASKLLQKAGVPGFAGAIAGAGLNVPLSKLSNESYVQLFGKICWANGQVAYQDTSGQVRVKPVSRMPPTLVSGSVYSNAVRYERLAGAESPCEKITVVGTILKAEKAKNGIKSSSEEYGPYSLINPSSTQTSLMLIERTIYSETLNSGSRTLKKVTETSQAKALLNPERYAGESSLIFSEIKTEKATYEHTPGGGGSTKCTDPDEGRLLKHEVEVRQSAEICLREWLANQPDEIKIDDRSDLIVASKIVRTYEYPPFKEAEDPLPGSMSTSSAKKRAMTITTETTECQGALLPGDFSMEESYGSNTVSAPIPLDAKFQKKSEIEVQTWTEMRLSDWELKTRKYQVLCKAYPEVAQRLEDNLAEESEGNRVLVLGAKLAMVPLSTEIERSNSGQSTPPAPERFPPESTIIEKPVKVTVNLPPPFGSAFRPREREFTVDGGLLTSKQQAEAIAQLEGHILWGRYKGQSITQNLDDALFGFSPLAGARWTDGSGYSHLFAMDGFSIAMAQNRVVVQYDGIWCGMVGGGAIPAPVSIAPPLPVTTVVSTPTGTVTTTVTTIVVPATPETPPSTTIVTVVETIDQETGETTTETTTEEIWTSPEESDPDIIVTPPYMESTRIEWVSGSSFELRAFDYALSGEGATAGAASASNFGFTGKPIDPLFDEEGNWLSAETGAMLLIEPTFREAELVGLTTEDDTLLSDDNLLPLAHEAMFFVLSGLQPGTAGVAQTASVTVGAILAETVETAATIGETEPELYADYLTSESGDLLFGDSYLRVDGEVPIWAYLDYPLPVLTDELGNVLVSDRGEAFVTGETFAAVTGSLGGVAVATNASASGTTTVAPTTGQPNASLYLAQPWELLGDTEWEEMSDTDWEEID